MRVGLIGFGTIARGMTRLIRADDEVEIVGALVADSNKPRGEATPPLWCSVDELLARQPDVVVEVGGHAALRSHGPAILRSGIDLLMVSLGALADPVVEASIVDAACAGRSRALIVSGAIGGLDAIAAAAVGGLDRVTHTTRKPARTLLDADRAARLHEPLELFRGSARGRAALSREHQRRRRRRFGRHWLRPNRSLRRRRPRH
jgi:aspartate dehydrogenase